MHCVDNRRTTSDAKNLVVLDVLVHRRAGCQPLGLLSHGTAGPPAAEGSPPAGPGPGPAPPRRPGSQGRAAERAEPDGEPHAALSAAVWLFVGAACLPLPIVRSPALSNSTTTCFSDLAVKQLTPGASIALVTVAELFGFVIPFGIIAWCTWKMRQSLQEGGTQLQSTSEKQKALRMVLMCAAVFFICFTPYHINFPFFMMVIENIIKDCTVHSNTLRFHPISLCLASLNCCLDPVLYYFMTSEFQDQLLRHGCAALWARLARSRHSLTMSNVGHNIRTKRRNLPRFRFWSLPKFFGRINSMEIPPMQPDELLLESIS